MGRSNEFFKMEGGKKNGGGGHYREFKDKHARTLIITRIRQCENVSGMNKYKMPRRF